MITFRGQNTGMTWAGGDVAYDEAGIRAKLHDLSQACYVVQGADGRIGVANGGTIAPNGAYRLLGQSSAISPSQLGNPDFQTDYGVQYNYTAGAMANAIASEDLVIALGNAGLLASFGAAGCVPPRLQAAIDKIKTALPNKPYAFNLIHSPSEEAMERNAVKMYLDNGIKIVEASAFLDLTPHIVWYRAAGLSQNPDGSVKIGNRVIAKLSRREVAILFMRPAPERLLQPLVEQGLITPLQAELAQKVPVADDITCEADSGGHTDNRPLVSLLPSILAL
ncbi:MAG TPA: hypothetical protein PLZ51_25755, partial [Aggregatilineales bacterium]|nr:hypothetical protein [Aggregatilineales bacterium]